MNGVMFKESWKRQKTSWPTECNEVAEHLPFIQIISKVSNTQSFMPPRHMSQGIHVTCSNHFPPPKIEIFDKIQTLSTFIYFTSLQSTHR